MQVETFAGFGKQAPSPACTSCTAGIEADFAGDTWHGVALGQASAKITCLSSGSEPVPVNLHHINTARVYTD